MATVRMSKTLIDQILNNFKNQCATAYANNSGAGDFVQEVNRSLHSPDFYALIDKHQEYQEMVEAFRTKNNEQNAHYYERNTEQSRFPFTLCKSVFFVVNANRPDMENRTQLDTWSMETYDTGSLEERTTNKAENFVQGDRLIELEVTNPMEALDEYDTSVKGMPFYKAPRDDRPWNLHDDFRHQTVQAKNPIVISETSDIQRLETVAGGTFKIKQAVEDMENYLKQLTTLKQFVDNWSGGSELVPDEYLQRLNKKVVRNKATLDIPTLADDLKADINTAIFENKLLGEDDKSTA